MVPTLEIGQRVLTNRLIDHPSVGDIVVFHPPKGADPPNAGVRQSQPGRRRWARAGPATGRRQQESSQTFIKRVVGGPGDRISIVNGHVIRNGVRENDSYIEPCGSDR